jgi:acetyltransferase-like isoleucine patch superfamily enzyme
MKSSLAAILDGRPAIACGSPDYIGRFCDRSVAEFECVLDDSLAGQSWKGVPIRAVGSLAEERREVCVFLFGRDLGPMVLRLAAYGLRWGVNLFDARVFGDGVQEYDEYRVLAGPEEAADSPDVDLHQGVGAIWTGGRVVVRKTRSGAPASVFLAEYASFSHGDIVLSSDGRVCCGRQGRIRLEDNVSLPRDFVLNCSQASKVAVGRNVMFSAHSAVHTASYTEIAIGANCTFGWHLKLYAYAPIEIGAGCMIATNVYAASGAAHDITTASGLKMPKKIVLGDRVWVGWGAQLLAGAELGAGSMAASGSIVNRAFPERSLVAGVPAAIIAQDIGWDRDFSAYKKMYYPPTDDALNSEKS